MEVIRGSGLGSGSGSGLGSGPDYSSGYGYGYGYGSGYCFGSGSGYGSGFGSGYGSGAGCGCGSGYGSDYSSNNLLEINIYAEAWAPEQRARMEELRREGAVIAYWNSNHYGEACNGGGQLLRAAPGVIHVVDCERGPLRLCSNQALHATTQPTLWKGARTWVVALIGEVQQEGDKLGALIREIIGEVPR